MAVKENEEFSRDYLDPEKRSIGNALQVFFKDGSHTDRVAVEYPIGHRRRRADGIPLLKAKFERSIAKRLPPDRCEKILGLFDDQQRLEAAPVHEFVDLWIV